MTSAWRLSKSCCQGRYRRGPGLTGYYVLFSPYVVSLSNLRRITTEGDTYLDTYALFKTQVLFYCTTAILGKGLRVCWKMVPGAQR